MKKYCKNIDLTDSKLLERAFINCFENKKYRKDTFEFLLEKHLTKSEYKEEKKKAKQLDYSYFQPLYLNMIPKIQEMINNKNLIFSPIKYEKRYDVICGKWRNLAKQSPLQRLFDHIAILGLEEFFNKYVGELQIAGIKGRGNSYGINKIKQWMSNSKNKYAIKIDIKHCYENTDRIKVMQFLKRHIKNDTLLWMIEILINTYDNGLSIGSILSQYIENLYLAQLYHYIKEDLFKIRNTKQGPKRINLVNCCLFQMDDILIIGTNKKDLQKALNKILIKADELGHTIKTSREIIEIAKGGDKYKQENIFKNKKPIDILGVKFFRGNKTSIRKRTYRRMKRCFNHVRRSIKITVQQARRFIVYYGILKHTSCKKLIKRFKNQDIRCRQVVSLYDKEKFLAMQ